MPFSMVKLFEIGAPIWVSMTSVAVTVSALLPASSVAGFASLAAAGAEDEVVWPADFDALELAALEALLTLVAFAAVLAATSDASAFLSAEAAAFALLAESAPVAVLLSLGASAVAPCSAALPAVASASLAKAKLGVRVVARTHGHEQRKGALC